MRVLVTGGRNYDDREEVASALFSLAGVTAMVQGGATGADTLAKEWADELGIPCDTFEADWQDILVEGAVIRTNQYGQYNVLAGFQRNQKMLDEWEPDLVLAFPGGKGTKDMVERARKAGVPVEFAEG